MTAVHPQLRLWLDQLNQMIAAQRVQGIEGTPQLVRETLAGLTAIFITVHRKSPRSGMSPSTPASNSLV